jgi:PilZ domain-containing protein
MDMAVRMGCGLDKSCPLVPLRCIALVVGFRCWTPRPKGEEVERTPLLSRKEQRVALKMFVKLSSVSNPSSEIAPTIDISCHGARVVTRRNWRPDEQLSVRSIRGDLYSRGRVVHCQPYKDNSFLVGIQMYYPTGDWTAREGTKNT